MPTGIRKRKHPTVRPRSLVKEGIIGTGRSFWGGYDEEVPVDEVGDVIVRSEGWIDSIELTPQGSFFGLERDSQSKC